MDSWTSFSFYIKNAQKSPLGNIRNSFNKIPACRPWNGSYAKFEHFRGISASIFCKPLFCALSSVPVWQACRPVSRTADDSLLSCIATVLSCWRTVPFRAVSDYRFPICSCLSMPWPFAVCTCRVEKGSSCTAWWCTAELPYPMPKAQWHHRTSKMTPEQSKQDKGKRHTSWHHFPSAQVVNDHFGVIGFPLIKVFFNVFLLFWCHIIYDTILSHLMVS